MRSWRGGESDAFLELAAEGTLVVEAISQGDGADGHIRALQLLACAVDPELQRVLKRRCLEQSPEASLKLAGRQMHLPRDCLDGAALAEMEVGAIERGPEILVGAMVAQALWASRMTPAMPMTRPTRSCTGSGPQEFRSGPQGQAGNVSYRAIPGVPSRIPSVLPLLRERPALRPSANALY